ncbi:unnamed protein product [Cuscuta epithymum]|uniref:Uncharacterized protein n=1 Tax=Cuscuta epithymum TaxID=186058 RepID=A0AAV0C188_9ASTE|nr:unnamed protein product [Cuscuta epithymum]
MAFSFVLLGSIGEIPSSGDFGFTRTIIAGVKKMPLEIAVVGLQGIFQDEGLMIRLPLEPSPMMIEAWIQLICQFILFDFILLFLSFLSMNTVVVVFCNFYLSRTLTLGGGDESFALATLSSYRPNTRSANHIALPRVIDSPAGSKVGGWKCFLYLLYLLLNVLLSI